MTDPTPETNFDPKAFRRALGNFATGVTIITAVGENGEKVGVTASSFNSLSMDPPLVLWSSMKTARSCEIFETATHFAVNILASDQMDMSNHFARQQEDKFAGMDWQEGIGGAPLFPNCAGRFQCETYDKLDGGDHWIFVGKVVAFDDFGRSPLCFHQGSYAMTFSHPGATKKPTENAGKPAHAGRMGNHKFFLMLQAVQGYQDRYQPKLQTLDLNLIEARALLVLAASDAMTADELLAPLNSPMVEVKAALANLTGRDMIAKNGDKYILTDAGASKADQCWALADAHAEEAFSEFSQDQMDTFTTILRKLV
ncbi:flavin reductase (DIM6/NTAB) family NADH-FMN oxidoreductase RutF/DNA-binding MarR family transcriptional regulator [Loktanella ponticola]|uniref:Flavin reductase (DIM6/NTAB) family NADH-FMN oxidoreductase RutF/DNA-binding MarR family transcriptional regulator n=1 Tax=Yoonia ponticola TaxID=1524255 RepID=A0A7W9BIK3_9RHOB|nr:flavin reductase [Yoonia ponticola]MBB5720794.1 flavin reductase (DIM6/NTAB) family NADH-FMN oxidoreductase RutF/DNA-binding MarR family transcriptional regulator [Yoonia ponticola]